MPGLKFTKVDPGQQADAVQAARTELTRVQVLRLVSTVAKNPVGVAREMEVMAGSRYFYVRWMASEARLSLLFSTGAGDGFIDELLTFDRNTSELVVKKQAGATLLEPDAGPNLPLQVTPQRWFGLLCAGVICSGPKLVTHLNVWLEDSIRLLGDDAVLTNQIRSLFKGASQLPEFLASTINDPAWPMPVRYGAVAQWLCSGLSPKNTLQAQALLTSWLMREEIYGRQQLFNRHIALSFADTWRMHAQNRFHFCSPGTTVPALLTTLDGLEHGNSTLKSVLVAASSALKEPLGSFIERVL